MNLLPYPRSLKLLRGTYTLPKCGTVQFDRSLSPEVAAVITARLQSVAKEIGIEFLSEGRALRAPNLPPTIRASCNSALRNNTEEYALAISKKGIEISFRETCGLRAATATLRQLLREYGRRLPCLRIRDWPDFPRRGVMLDISRGRVPRVGTLLELVEHLADFKINELQLYTEHTFACRKYKSVWQDWGALTGREIRRLDARCRELGIELVPNQNSFGHLRHFLEHPRLKKLAEVSRPYADANGEFVRRPSTLAPNHPGTLPFLRGLYDELLPNFSSRHFNVGCDETFDLGHGQSKKLCERIGKGRVYLDFLEKIHREVSKRGRRMMFWGDIILKYPKLIPELASLGTSASGTAGRFYALKHAVPEAGAPSLIALSWGYEANHPFEKEAAQFAKVKIPFYVCPGTSTWQTLIGRHYNALANLRAAARAGKRFGAVGYLITDWGDGGHPQPLAVSYLPYLAGAALSWCANTFDEQLLVPVLSRDVFRDPTGRMAKAASALGQVHRQLGYTEPNLTPLGAVIAAPPPKARELFCRNGLKYHAWIPEKNIRATLREIEKQRIPINLGRRPPSLRFGATRHAVPPSANILSRELNLAARMAAQSCRFMLWQQACAAGRTSEAKRLARNGIRELRILDKEFNALWPLRNKATPRHCSAFLKWRIEDYLQ